MEFDLDAEAPLEFDLDARVGPAAAEPEDWSRERRLLWAPTSKDRSEITVATLGFSGFHVRKRENKCYYSSVKNIHND